MSELQKSFLRTIGCVLGGIVILAVSIAGIAYQWLWVGILWGIACGIFCVYAIAMAIGEWIYKWRVWGAVDKHEEDMYHTWKYAIFDGRINCSISKMEFGEYADDFSTDEEWEANYKFLLKMREVPIPKILQIGA